MNAKDPEVIEQFIALRARGLPYAKIAAELNVSTRTLIVWSRKFADRLANAFAIENEVANEPIRAADRARAKQIADLQDRVLLELSQRPLNDIPTDRLALLAWRLQRKFELVPDKLTFTEAFTDDHVAAGDIPDPTLTWQG
ncbi:MAG TPA: helix-turn-helix domain-containing protein [Candidatus Binatus sp.]|nr:helix-turn-helix domain-containing protein [Candidatus Binatus sp.]